MTEASQPFRSALRPSSSLFVDLGALGYVEEEFLMGGVAEARGPYGDVVEAEAPYVTRVLVRRPAQPGHFSGSVYVEPFHILMEDTPSWTNGHRHMVRRGDAWIGLTVNPGASGPAGVAMAGGVAQLQNVDPERYGRLTLEATKLPDPLAAGRPGMAFDAEAMNLRLSMANPQGHAIASQLGALLRSDAGPLGGYAVERVYASGWSQTGLFWKNYLDQGNHASLFDAYLINVAPGPDHRPDDAVVVNMLSEAEVVGTLNPPMAVGDDTDSPRYRGYEVPGAFHYWQLSRRMAGWPGAEHSGEHNDRSWYRVVHALLDNVERWVRDGEPMPRAEGIARDPSAPDGVGRDQHDNALGGLRSTWVDVPTAQYLARCTCNPGTGAMRPFGEAEVERLYGGGDGYRDAVARRADELVRDRWLMAVDAEELKADPT